MKGTPLIDGLSVASGDVGSGGTYPPLGFIPVWDAELGNGDYYGLYWPYGREDQEPMICDMLHDEWGMQVSFSSVAVFSHWLELNDGFRGDVEVEDFNLVTERYQKARSLLRDHPVEALVLLKGICQNFPESAEYWFTYASQLRRKGDHAAANSAFVRSFTSNWAFGFPPNGILQALHNANGQSDDPVVRRSGAFTMKYGGEKENTNYRLLRECIEEYLMSTSPVLGLLLNQNYAYMMLMETGSFQEREGFDAADWIKQHTELCIDILGDSRTAIT